MGFKEEWAQLPAQTKMMIVGGGGVALFFLFTAFKNRNNAAQQTAQQDTSTGPQTAAVDPTGWMDQQTQNMQAMQQLIGGMQDSMQQSQQANQDANNQNMQAIQQIIQQNQQATQQQLQTILGNMGQAPSYPAAPAPAAPPKPAPAQPAPVKSAPAPILVTGKVNPSPIKAAPAPTTGTYTVKPGDNLWNITKNDVLPKGASNSTILITENKIASANKLPNPNLILPGQKLIISASAKPVLAPVKAAPAKPAQAPASKTVTVQKGQTLWGIAQNNLSKGASNASIAKEVNVLASANHIANANLIRAGQKITL